MVGYYDRRGEPMTLDEWIERFADEAYKRVEIDVVDGATVSTVWLGANHNWGAGPPLIFETMVFGGPLDGEQDRYSTEAEAVAGHADMLVRALVAAFAEHDGPRLH